VLVWPGVGLFVLGFVVRVDVVVERVDGVVERVDGVVERVGGVVGMFVDLSSFAGLVFDFV